jgi:hypothetical protein
MIMFTTKFVELLISQMNIITNRSLLLFNCKSINALLKVLLISGDWLNAFVAIERLITAIKGIAYDKKKSRKVAKWIIGIIFLVATLTTGVHDSLYRRLIDDDDDQRTWCILSITSAIQQYDSVINTIHVFAPFSINVLSVLLFIVNRARTRFRAQKQLSYRGHLRQQFKKHKQLLISPCLLVLLASPRLIISFISGCMKSTREPWLFLAGNFLAYVQPMLIFFVFVLPSEIYKKQFKMVIEKLRRRYMQRC